jgi:hypothetical protein
MGLRGSQALEAVIAPTLLNGWVNYDDGTTFRTAAYWKTPQGVVQMRGMIKNGTLNADAFVLPAGYRPSTNSAFCVCNSDAGSYGVVGCRVGGNGQVIFPTGTAADGRSLEQLTFRPDQ